MKMEMMRAEGVDLGGREGGEEVVDLGTEVEASVSLRCSS